MRPSKLALWIISFVLCWILIIFLADQGRLPGLITNLYAFPNGDKVGHFFLMGGLSFCVNLALKACRTSLFGWSILTGSLAVAFFITAEEFSQLFFQTRTFDLLDLGASLLGVWVFGRAAAALLGKTRASS